MYTIYFHRNKTNNKFYIGQTGQSLDKIWRNGEGYKTQAKFYSAIQKYGWNNFEHGVLEENLTLEEANEKEQYYIKEHNSIDNGYNVLFGGDNHILTEEVKNKISETKKSQHARRAKTKNEYSVRRRGKSFLWKKHSEETRKEMSENHANVKGELMLSLNPSNAWKLEKFFLAREKLQSFAEDAKVLLQIVHQVALRHRAAIIGRK